MNFVTSYHRDIAWREMARLLIEESPRLNVIVEVRGPQAGTQLLDTDRQLYESLAGEVNIKSTVHWRVAMENTFPWSHYENHGIRGVFEDYVNDFYPQYKRKGGWGAYAHRMLVREDSKGNIYNPLERIMDKLRSEIATGNAKRSCYELNMYDDAKDGGRRMGQPCLNHLSFKLMGHKLHMNAYYRSQDCYGRAMMNLHSLCHLMTFVSRETGLKAGKLTMMASFAFAGASKRALQEGIDIYGG